ncbi:hypothetical protein PFAG_00575 [Plasmodium falciparum Santa Lucia]|uniref:Uncharacterized protein n=1 Tax=Plasmodium falciparum Santa Lucia TaxID=478859 RepID=W7G3Y8_PLAFA|nr:hypothetical protein PFAG_00575 [Plasmodium falciparum Santa Lucia]
MYTYTFVYVYKNNIDFSTIFPKLRKEKSTTLKKKINYKINYINDNIYKKKKKKKKKKKYV